MRLMAVLLAIASGLLAGCEERATEESETARDQAAIPDGWERAEVVRIVDGDTIVVVVAGREERVRYIGIDTPESVQPSTPIECFGREASNENERLVEGRTIYLERDVSNTDRFGRLLRYVHVDDPHSDEWLFVNLELVRRGYANAVTFPPDVEHETALSTAEREAREAGRGLWGACQ
jgi:micrococcal nuclease